MRSGHKRKGEGRSVTTTHDLNFLLDYEIACQSLQACLAMAEAALAVDAMRPVVLFLHMSHSIVASALEMGPKHGLHCWHTCQGTLAGYLWMPTVLV